MAIRTKTTGRRGKYAEGKVQDFLKSFGEQHADFDWSRIYDARSAGGKFPSRPGDFEFFRAVKGLGGAAIHGLIEVKEVENEFRLPAKNFNSGQIARLRLREMAGGVIVVLVCHMPMRLWRRVPLTFFREQLDVPSWELTDFSLWDSAASALFNVQGFSK